MAPQQMQHAVLSYKQTWTGTERPMTSTVNELGAAQRARTRALIVPREHGAWGLLLIPLFTGVVAGLRSAQHFWPLLLFVAAAFCLFWLRTPVESLVGSGPMVARTSAERRVALQTSILLAIASVACLAGLMWGGRNLILLLLGGAAAIAFVIQAVLRRSREMRMASQLMGAIGLTATAPAAYYLGTGHFDAHAVALWAANWTFAGDQIHFVQLRIHAGRATGFREKFSRGRFFFIGQGLLLVALTVASLWRVISPLVIIAFVPALVRGTRWFFQAPEPLDVKKLGWSEVKYGIAFGIFLAVAFLVR